MIPRSVKIFSSEDFPFKKKICGLYPLERLIHVLYSTGIKKIYLTINREELQFFHDKILVHLKRLKGLEYFYDPSTMDSSPMIKIPSSLFTQQQYFEKFEKYFKKEDKYFVPEINNEQFTIENKSHIKKARYILKRKILNNTPGFFARNINKRMSLPISAHLSATRIPPNAVTSFNLLCGIACAVLIFLNSYLTIALAGIIFQVISIFDGVDGEIARLTFRRTKSGAIFDTVTDLSSLVIFLIACTYLFLNRYDGLIPILIFIFMITGLGITIFAQWLFLKNYDEPVSIRTYWIEFLEKLPKEDKLVTFTLSVKYLVKKELYSLLFMVACLAGIAHLIIPFASLFVVVSSFLLLTLNFRYLAKFKK
ncbi:CDP-alcohol phosphatidyltransferase family protein [Spirochaetota bacterium]